MNGITMLICWLSIPAVSKDLKLSESTTRSVLNDLRKAGLVPTEQRFRENGGIAVCSILCDQSMKTRHLSATEAYDTVFRIISKAKKLRMFTDKGLRNLGLFTLAEDVVKTTGVEYYVLDVLPPEPSYRPVPDSRGGDGIQRKSAVCRVSAPESDENLRGLHFPRLLRGGDGFVRGYLLRCL